VHLGARQVQRLGQRRDSSFGHVAQRVLQLVENLDQGIGVVAMLLCKSPSRSLHPCRRHPEQPSLLSFQGGELPEPDRPIQSVVPMT
jgi:hypothetical protein